MSDHARTAPGKTTGDTRYSKSSQPVPNTDTVISQLRCPPHISRPLPQLLRLRTAYLRTR